MILYYAEELKQRVVDCVRSTDTMRAALRVTGTIERVPRGVKQEHKKAINALVDDGLLTPDERLEINKLVNFRNTIAHELHNLTADLSNEQVVRDVLINGSARPSHDYSAVDRIRYFLKLLDRRIVQHGYVVSLRFDWLLFHARTTLTAHGVGVRWGFAGFRIGRSPTGLLWVSFTVPGTGLSFFKYLSPRGVLSAPQSGQPSIPVPPPHLTPNQRVLEEIRRAKP